MSTQTHQTEYDPMSDPSFRHRSISGGGIRLPRRDAVDPRDIDLTKVLSPEEYAEALKHAPVVVEGPDLRIGSITPPEPPEPPTEAARGLPDDALVAIIVHVWQKPDRNIEVKYSREGKGNQLTQQVAKVIWDAMMAGHALLQKGVADQVAQEGARRKDIQNQHDKQEEN